MTIEKKPDESKLDYHKRLVYGKLVDKTLSDLDYTEIATLVYGQPYSSDVARRMLYGSRRTLELMDSERVDNISDNSITAEIDEKILMLQKERQRFYDQRREYNKLISSDSRQEHLYEIISEAANNLAQTVGSLYADNSPIDPVESDNDAILVFSDWHYGMVTDNVFNKYDVSICKRRVANVVKSAAQRLNMHGCNTLHIVVLGDLIHGAIHTSARVASEELVSDQIMQVSEILAQSINELSKYAKNTIVYITYGNHARTVANKSDSIHKDNLERLIPWWISERLSGNNNIYVDNSSDTEFLFINACGHEICATHGDLDSVRTSPRLLSSLFQKKYGKNIEYILLGDKHHSESFEELGITSMLCGSLCGADDFANDKRLFSTPSQVLLIVNSECGVDAEYRIKCE